MRALVRLSLAALAAGLLLSGLVSAASANRLSVSNTRIRAVWSALTFESKETETITTGQIRCAVTMEGSFHSGVIVKTAGALIGLISRATVTHPCTGGEYYFHNGTEAVLGNPADSLPWHIRYFAFTGMLPTIATVVANVVGIRMTVNYGLAMCLEIYGSATETRKWVFNVEARGGVTSLEPIAGTLPHLIVRQGTSMLCPELGKLSGASGPVTILGTSTAITIRLI
jgi:hypothetical protein